MGTTEIHATAIVHPNAKLGAGTTVGPYSIIGEHVETGKDCNIQEHVVLRGHTRLGDEVQIFPFATIGGEPQHLKYQGEPTRVEIGNRVILREATTVHRGTEFGNKVTLIGDESLIMAYTHVAHDCIVGQGVVIANAVQMAGHVLIEDFATVGGLSAIAQHCRLGRYCYVGGGSILRKDLAPYLLGKGTDFAVQGVNAVGLKRKGVSTEAINRLKALYRIFFLQNLTTSRALEKAMIEVDQSGEVKVFIDFVQSSKMGLTR